MRFNTPKTWYDYGSKHSLELLTNYVRKIESQITSGIEHFETNKGSEFVVDDADEGTGQVVEYYDGLEDMTWNLDDIHKVYFPNLQRTSAFLTMYAFLEPELEKLARILKRDLSLDGDLHDIEGTGVHRSLKYMLLIAKLPIQKGAAEWNRLTEINKLRNLIIHNDGKLTDHNGKRRSEAKVIDQFFPHVTEHDGHLLLSPTFLTFLVQQFSELFQFLDRAIKAKYKKD